MNTSFFGEMLNSITERGRALLDRTRDRRDVAAARSESLADLCEELLSGRGEASGVALAGEILEKYSKLKVGPRIAFFETLANRFGPDREELEAAIKAGGSTLRDYAGANGRLGRFQHRFKVYDREDKRCAKKGCGGTVRRIVQGGRSTFYCPNCQR